MRRDCHQIGNDVDRAAALCDDIVEIDAGHCVAHMIHGGQADARGGESVHADVRVDGMRRSPLIAHQLGHDAQPARAAGRSLVALRGVLHQRGAHAVEQAETDELLLAVECPDFALADQPRAALMSMPSSAGTAMKRTLPSSSPISAIMAASERP